MPRLHWRGRLQLSANVRPPANGCPVQTSPSPHRLLGFSRDEWSKARFDDPIATSQFLEFFDTVFDPATSEQGALVGVGPEALLAIARVSPAFAGRLRSYYESLDPDWRRNMAMYPAAFISGPEDRRAEMVRAQWAATLALLDASND
jgi:hypothetical protein